MSFFLDTLILLRTFKTILVGLRHSTEETPGPGPGCCRRCVGDQACCAPRKGAFGVSVNPDSDTPAPPLPLPDEQRRWVVVRTRPAL